MFKRCCEEKRRSPRALSRRRGAHRERRGDTSTPRSIKPGEGRFGVHFSSLHLKSFPASC
jgi:hypothetical protein